MIYLGKPCTGTFVCMYVQVKKPEIRTECLFARIEPKHTSSK